jgi:hypothetical protein
MQQSHARTLLCFGFFSIIALIGEESNRITPFSEFGSGRFCYLMKSILPEMKKFFSAILGK